MQGPLELSMTVIDSDMNVGEDDLIDNFTIPFSDQLRANSMFSDAITQRGVCGRATFSVRINITSLCPANMYGPNCDIVCEDGPARINCNYLGVCLGNINCIQYREYIIGSRLLRSEVGLCPSDILIRRVTMRPLKDMKKSHELSSVQRHLRIIAKFLSLPRWS